MSRIGLLGMQVEKEMSRVENVEVVSTAVVFSDKLSFEHWL